MHRAEETSVGLRVYLDASHNDIQALQDESNIRDAYLRQARKEFLEARTTTERKTTQLNQDLMLLRELLDECKAVVAFIETVPFRLNAQN